MHGAHRALEAARKQAGGGGVGRLDFRRAGRDDARPPELERKQWQQQELETMKRTRRLERTLTLSLLAAVYSQTSQENLAERTYRQILSRNPSAEDALVSLGRLLMRTGRGDEGTQLLNRGAQARQRTTKAADQRLAIKTALFQANESAKQKHFAEALAKVDQVLGMDARNSDALALKARLLLGQNNAAGALDSIQQAIQVNPFFGGHYYLLGLIQARHGNRQAALAAFQKALLFDPSSEDAAARVREFAVR